jgi:hypothetical protein
MARVHLQGGVRTSAAWEKICWHLGTYSCGCDIDVYAAVEYENMDISVWLACLPA